MKVKVTHKTKKKKLTLSRFLSQDQITYKLYLFSIVNSKKKKKNPDPNYIN